MQYAGCFSLRMRTPSIVLRPSVFYFPLHAQEPSMVATKEAQEQEVGVQMSVVCQKTFFLALRIIAFRSTLSKAKHPSLWRLFRHHQTAVNLLAIYICRYLYYIYICVCV